MEQKECESLNRERRPEYIGWILTKKCNLSCPHCYVAKFSDEELTGEQRISLIEDAYRAGLRKLDLTGGEVLLFSENLLLIDYICSLGIELTLFTNGTTLDENKAKFLSRYPLRVVMSLDGSRNETHKRIRGEGSWEKALKAASLLWEKRIPFSTITAINDSNFSEIEDQILLAKRLKAEEAVFILTMPAGRASKDMVIDQKSIVGLLKRISSTAHNLKFPVSLWCMPFADLWVDSPYVSVEHCRSQKPEIIDLDPLGNLMLCDVSNVRYSNVLKKGILAALREQSRDPLYLSLFNPKLSEPCSQCINRQKCKGGCYARAEIYGNILGPDPFCPSVAEYMEDLTKGEFVQKIT